MERSHRGLVRWFAKPVRVSKPFGGSNPPLSARKFYQYNKGLLECRPKGFESSYISVF